MSYQNTQYVQPGVPVVTQPVIVQQPVVQKQGLFGNSVVHPAGTPVSLTGKVPVVDTHGHVVPDHGIKRNLHDAKDKMADLSHVASHSDHSTDRTFIQ